MGRNAQAMEEAERAVELDPLSVYAHDGLAKTANAVGQYGVAVAESHKVLELDPGNPVGYADRRRALS
jgi:Flp pilus assembly protein TadD